MQKDTETFFKSMEAGNCGVGGSALNVTAMLYFSSDMALDLIEQGRINHILSGMIKGSDYFSTEESYTGDLLEICCELEFQ